VPLRLETFSQVAPLFRLAQVLRERRVDILHSHMFQASRLASALGWLCRVPVVIETPHVREQWRRGWLKSRFFVDRLVGRFDDYCVAVSEANARYLIEQKQLPAHKVKVIRNGINLQRFDPARPLPSGMKQALGFGERDPVLIVVGRLEPQKGHSVLLQALPKVLRDFPHARLVCVGEGRLRQDLEQQTRILQLQDAVRFVGYQSNIADWLLQSDISILPSLYEGLPLVAIESLAAGRPVVATSVDGTPEVIIDGKTGVTVPPGDTERLAEAISILLRDPELRRNLGLRGRALVLECFGEERQVQETQQLYLEAWERRLAIRHAAVEEPIQETRLASGVREIR
jgi:glycosyltransferase involved in cell wall biosynthesis